MGSWLFVVQWGIVGDEVSITYPESSIVRGGEEPSVVFSDVDFISDI